MASAAGGLLPVKHKTVQHIQTAGPPALGRFRRLDLAKLAATKAEFSKLEKDGIIRRSSSNWSASLHMVMKPDGTWRPCGDYRRLNLATTLDSYLLPNIQDLSSRLHGCSIFSKLDLRKGYYQIPVQEGDIHKTAVITPFGLWEFLRMPFGLCNAGQSFQRFMDEVLSGLDFAFCTWMIFSSAAPAQRSTCNTSTWYFSGSRSMAWFSTWRSVSWPARRSISWATTSPPTGRRRRGVADGASPILRHVQAIQDFPAPQDKKQLQTFLGMVNFYRRFIPAVANILLPLTDALRADWSWIWAPAMQHSFQLVKDTLAEVATLTHPDPAADISLAVDASNTHIGAVLQQWQPGGGGRSGGWRPLSFFSKKLDAAQLKYSAFDRELLAAYLSVRHFRYMLDGRKFHILSDHKQLTQALHRVSDPWTPRVQRQLSFLAVLTSDIRHVPGKANVVADALSRPPPSAVASVKEPLGSLATARQGGKPNTSTPLVPEQRPTASAAAGAAARPPLSAVVSVNAPAGSLTTARQRGKPNPLPSSPAVQPAACGGVRRTRERRRAGVYTHIRRAGSPPAGGRTSGMHEDAGSSRLHLPADQAVPGGRQEPHL